MPEAPLITVIIVTRNRAAELVLAIRSVLSQPPAHELVVIDDGSTDETPRMVRAEFPQVTFQRFEQTQGHIVHRNAAVLGASAPIALILDDDATLATGALARTLEDFGHPRVGAVAVPFSEHGTVSRQPPAPDRQRVWVTNQFVGAIHALRKDAFAKIGGYRSDLRHFGEESDLCMRFLAGGYVVRMGTAAPGEHNFSTNRDRTYERFYAARNAIVFPWHNVPMPLALGLMAARAAQESVRGLRRMPGATFRGLAAGVVMCAATARSRRPPDMRTYRLFQELRKRRAVPLDEIVPRLAPMR